MPEKKKEAEVEKPVEVVKEVPFKGPPSEGYLVVDTKKCSGCTSCMLACSLAHEGETGLSLSRIQIAQSSFARYPTDIEIGKYPLKASMQ